MLCFTCSVQLGHVKDLATAFVKILGNKKAARQIYNISGEARVYWPDQGQLGRALCPGSVRGSHLPGYTCRSHVLHASRWPGDPTHGPSVLCARPWRSAPCSAPSPSPVTVKGGRATVSSSLQRHLLLKHTNQLAWPHTHRPNHMATATNVNCLLA